jgi:hypothetical protein
MGKRKEFAGEPSGKKKVGGKKPALQAEIRVEGRDFVFDAAKAVHGSVSLQKRLMGFVKELKKLDKELAHNIEEGVLKGKRANMLFPSMADALQEAQLSLLKKHDVAVGLYGKIVEQVPVEKLDAVRLAVAKAMGGFLAEKARSKPAEKHSGDGTPPAALPPAASTESAPADSMRQAAK